MELLVKETVQKICLLFKSCSVAKEGDAVDLASAPDRSGNGPSLAAPKKPATQPKRAKATVSGRTLIQIVFFKGN